jgi:hypothetical protein
MRSRLEATYAQLLDNMGGIDWEQYLPDFRARRPRGTVRFEFDELLCPCCGHNCTHLQHVNQVEGYDPTRLDVELVFTCEAGCSFAVVVRQHKGNTYMEYVEAPPSESP